MNKHAVCCCYKCRVPLKKINGLLNWFKTLSCGGEIRVCPECRMENHVAWERGPYGIYYAVTPLDLPELVSVESSGQNAPSR